MGEQVTRLAVAVVAVLPQQAKTGVLLLAVTVEQARHLRLAAHP